MAKIVLAFHNHLLYRSSDHTVPIPAFYEGFVKGLVEAGNELLVYNHTMFWANSNVDADYVPPEKVSFDISKFNPDLVILFNNSFYDISNIVNCPIVIYEVDSPLYYSNTKLLKTNGNKFLYCVAQSSNIELITKLYGVNKKNIIHMPFFSQVQPEKKQIKSNICFIGSKFCGFSPESTFNKFMKTIPNNLEIEEFKRCVEVLKAEPFLTENKIFNIAKAKSEKVKTCFCKSDLIWFISDSNRIRTLSQIADLGLDLYGNTNWMSDLIYEPELTLSYKNVSVSTIKQNQDIYNSSKIGININHMQASHGFSWRVCDIMASNACLVSSYTPDLKSLFPGVNIPTFTNRFEARDLCIKLLNNENLRLDIVLQCQEIINKNYRFENLLSKLEAFTNINLHTKQSGKSNFVSIDTPKFITTPVHSSYNLNLLYSVLQLLLEMISFGRFRMNRKYVTYLQNFLNIRYKKVDPAVKAHSIHIRLKFLAYIVIWLIFQIPFVRDFITITYKNKIINKIRRCCDVIF